MDPIEALRRMMLIRAFETALAKRRDHGFQLLSTGEEAVAVGLGAALTCKDQLLTGGRSIGPALARGVEPGKVMAELLGKIAGLNRGRAGRGHMSDPRSGFFGAHAVVGGNISIAAGVALAKHLADDGGIVAVLFGDGACGAGALHETLNIAACWRLPLLFVCNNNQLSVSTARTAALAPVKLSNSSARPSGCGRAPSTVRMSPASRLLLLSVPCMCAKATARPSLNVFRCGFHRIQRRRAETRSRATMARTPHSVPDPPTDCGLTGVGTTRCRAGGRAEREATARVAEALALADASAHPDRSEALDHVG